VVNVSSLSSTPRPIVEIERVHKDYETRGDSLRALEDVSLEIREGEFLSIVGASGCGKSTLLLLIAGLVPLTSGTVRIMGKPVRAPYTDLGIVFQDPVLLDWRTALGNLMLQAQLRKLDLIKSNERAMGLLELVGLRGFEDRYPHELSGGMRQRVAICRALMHDPPLLLMDEPFGALDALTRDQLNVDVEAIWRRSNKTVVFVTHSITEAVFLSDRIAVFTPRPGRIHDIVEIDLPRPRHLSVRETAEFGRYSRRIRHMFAAMGVLREDAEAPERVLKLLEERR
jgi:NitT/TauT family transport system ATP-binding protein